MVCAPTLAVKALPRERRVPDREAVPPQSRSRDIEGQQQIMSQTVELRPQLGGETRWRLLEIEPVGAPLLMQIALQIARDAYLQLEEPSDRIRIQIERRCQLARALHNGPLALGVEHRRVGWPLGGGYGRHEREPLVRQLEELRDGDLIGDEVLARGAGRGAQGTAAAQQLEQQSAEDPVAERGR